MTMRAAMLSTSTFPTVCYIRNNRWISLFQKQINIILKLQVQGYRDHSHIYGNI